ncbi:MAG: flagellar basal-body MS-ring/collar protein FliF [Opitutales bacterium]
MNETLNQYASFWKQLDANQKVSILVSTLIVVVGAVALFFWAQRPNMSLLFGSVSSKDAAAIVDYLDQEGIDYELRSGGSAIFVPREAVYKVRMDVSSQGLVQGDGTGFEIFDRSSFGISDFIQRTNYIRAIQGELGRTITQLRGVNSARVMVVVPENRLLVVDDSVETTASVFVDIGGGKLDAAAVRSIQALVANSVLGLTLPNVAVVDNNGNVLSTDRDEDDVMRMGSSMVEFRQNLEKYFSGKVESMLERVVGPGNVVVRVSTDVETAQVSTTQEDFNDEGGVLREQISSEVISSSTDSEPSGVPGDAAIGEEAQAATSSRESRDETVDREQRFEIDRTVTNRVEAPGRIQRMSASVFVAMKMDPPAAEGEEPQPVPRTEAEMEQLRRMVANALGISTEDDAAGVIAIQETVFNQKSDFALPEQAAAGFDPAMLLDYIDQIVGGFIALILFVVFLRMLKRARAEQGPLDRVQEMRMEERAESETFGNQALTPEILNGLIRQKPENVSSSLRKWLSGESAQ